MNINGFSNDNLHQGDVRITGDLEVDGNLEVDGKIIIPTVEATTIETDNIQTLTSGSNLRFSDSAGVQAMKLYDGGVMGIGNTDGTDYKLPVADGTAGQLLTTDGAGSVSFSDIPATSEFVLAKKYTMNNTRNVWTTGTFSQIDSSGTGTRLIDASEIVVGNQIRITARGVYNGSGPGVGTAIFRFQDSVNGYTDDSAGITMGTGTYTNNGFWELNYTITPITSNLAVYTGTVISTNLPTGEIKTFALRSPITRSSPGSLGASIFYNPTGYNLVTLHYSVDIIKSLDLVGGAGGVGTTDHLTLTNLNAGTDGDAGHDRMVINTGRVGGQSIFGGVDSGNDLFLYSTSNVTRGNIVLSDEVISSDILPLSATNNIGSTASQWRDILLNRQLSFGDPSGIANPTQRPRGIRLISTGAAIANIPTVEIYKNSSAYPNLQMGLTSFSSNLLFDCYRNGITGTIDSSDAGSNYYFSKQSNELRFLVDSGVAVGSSMSPFVGMYMDTTGRINTLNVVPQVTNASEIGSATRLYSKAHISELGLYGSTSGNIGIKASNTTTSHALTLPPAQGVNGTVLTNNGSGGLYWADTGSAWEFYSGDDYTPPVVIAPSTPTTLTNNGVTHTDTSQGPLSGAHFWNTTTDKITPEFNGDSYSLEIRLDAETDNANGYFELDIDIGGGMIIPLGVFTFPKGLGVVQRFSKTTAIFTLGTFLANGGLIRLTSLIGSTTISGFAVLISRSHRSR